MFQEGLDELGVETPIEDITLTYLTSGSTTEVQAEREYIQQSLEETLGLTVELIPCSSQTEMKEIMTSSLAAGIQITMIRLTSYILTILMLTVCPLVDTATLIMMH